MLQMSIRTIMQMRLSSNLLPMHVRVIDGAKQLSVVNNNQVYLGAGNSAVRDKSVGVDVGRQTNNGGNGCGRTSSPPIGSIRSSLSPVTPWVSEMRSRPSEDRMAK